MRGLPHSLRGKSIRQLPRGFLQCAHFLIRDEQPRRHGPARLVRFAAKRQLIPNGLYLLGGLLSFKDRRGFASARFVYFSS